MALVPLCWPDDAVICRACARCATVLQEIPQDELVCPRCGRVKVWTVSVNGQVVAAGRKNMLGGTAIWLAGQLDDLLPAPGRELAGSRGGWNDEI